MASYSPTQHPCFAILWLIVCLAIRPIKSFLATPSTTQQRRYVSTCLYNDRPAPPKTYGETPIRDMIDSEAAMNEFFTSRDEWTPLFRSISNTNVDFCPAKRFLFDSSTTTAPAVPWKELVAIPQNEDDRNLLASFLDSMHQSLLDIPVTESKAGEEDENDVHFLEEGRRMLAISRFHVLRSETTAIEAYDDLFTICWSELLFLSQNAEAHTGSLILVPQYDLSDLRRFADMNLMRPLEWLGVDGEFEIASLHRYAPALRLLYKLEAMPSTHSRAAAEEEE